MYLKDLMELCDAYRNCGNEALCDEVKVVVGLNFIHYKKIFDKIKSLQKCKQESERVKELLSKIICLSNVKREEQKGQLFYRKCSPACDYCTEDAGFTARIVTRCNRNCFFCFVSDTTLDDEIHIDLEKIKKDILEKNARQRIRTFAVSGGEPLLARNETVALFQWVREHLGSEIYLRLYTNGDYISETVLKELRSAGLDEMRISIKPDSHVDYYLIKKIKKYIPVVIVEIPVIPGSGLYLFKLLDELEQSEIDGLNLIELFFNGYRVHEFQSRNLAVFMPDGVRNFGCAEFPYEYPIAGSLELALKAVQYIQANQYHYFAYICSQNTKKAQYFHSNKMAINEKIKHLDDGNYNEDGNLKVLGIYSDCERAMEIINKENVPFYSVENKKNITKIYIPITYQKYIDDSFDSCYVTLSKAMYPVWIEKRNHCENSDNFALSNLMSEMSAYEEENGAL